MEDLIIVFGSIEHLGIGLEGNGSTVLVRFSDNGHILGNMSPRELHLMDLTILMNFNYQPLGKGVDDRSTNTMETAGNLITATAELTAGMEYGKNNFQSGFTGLRLNIYRNTSAIVGNRNGISGIDGNGDLLTIACKSLVNGIVYDLVNKVMQTTGRSGTDIHTGTHPNCFQTL